jgi:hypothetical protein
LLRLRLDVKRRLPRGLSHSESCQVWFRDGHGRPVHIPTHTAVNVDESSSTKPGNYCRYPDVNVPTLCLLRLRRGLPHEFLGGVGGRARSTVPSALHRCSCCTGSSQSFPASFEMSRTYAANLWLGLLASSCGESLAFGFNETIDNTKWGFCPSRFYEELDPIFVSVAAVR